jgi:excisionase family DNA binding protein
MPDPKPLLIDINELSTRLSIPKGTLYNLVYLKRIPYLKIGRSLRFDLAQIRDFLACCSSTIEMAGKR